jgi:putative ABC transport system permease protein
MNLFQLVFKQMRQRALGTVLTLISVLLGVALATSITIVRRGADALFGQTSFGYDIVVGKQGSPLQLVVNTVYHISTSPGNIPYTYFEKMERDRTFHSLYRVAVPFAVGDSYPAHNQTVLFPIVGTLPRIFGMDDATGLPKKGYDATGRALPGFLDADASDEDVEAANGKEKRDPVFEYKPGQKLELAEGKFFRNNHFEAVIGYEVAKETNLKIGSIFQATHGFPRPDEKPDIHKPKWTVVGILSQTHTANDKCLFIPLMSFYTIAEHWTGLVAQEAIREGKDPSLALKEFEAQEAAIKAEREKEKHEAAAKSGAASQPAGDDDDDKDNYTLDADGNIKLDATMPTDIWGISGIMVKARGGHGVLALKYIINNGNVATAANPAEVMREFFANFIDNYSDVLLVVSALVSVVAGIGILVSIYNSVAARMKEIAILRALGATKEKVLSMICLEAGLIGLFGGIGGIILGHGAAGVGSYILNQLLGQGIEWQSMGQAELLYFVGVIVLSVLAGLVPALKAYRVPVATNLTA